jgi:hypothetical protein
VPDSAACGKWSNIPQERKGGARRVHDDGIQNVLHVLRQGGGQGDEDGDDEDDEQPSDEAMFRMDAMVAAVLQKGAAGRPSARETREHLRNFKFR